MSFQQEFRRSIDNAKTFLKNKTRQLSWYKQPDTILLVDSQGIHHWFADGELNTCFMALDYHVENGRADQPALIYHSSITSQQKSDTYADLRDQVAL